MKKQIDHTRFVELTGQIRSGFFPGRYILSLFIFALLPALMANTVIAAPETVAICDDGGEWPPYIYYNRTNGKIDKSAPLEGATIELFNEVFKRSGLDYTIELIAWKRCLEEVTNFAENKNYEIVTNGSYNEDRQKNYYVSAPLYKTHQGLFYSTDKHKQAPIIRSAKDLNKYSLCGILGYNYTMYTALGVKEEIDTGAKSLVTVLKKISEGRCDFFPSPMESVLGGQTIGLYKLPKNIEVVKVPWVGATTFHLFVSKSSPRAYELYTKINQQIMVLQGRGIAGKIFKKYLPQGDGF
ncbi:MAG: transporter substrate-binding domain-containing protein [Sneathiella sp.]